MASDPPIEALRGIVELPSTDGIVPAVAEHGAVLVRSLRLGERAQIRLAASLGRVVGARQGVAQVRYEDTDEGIPRRSCTTSSGTRTSPGAWRARR